MIFSRFRRRGSALLVAGAAAAVVPLLAQGDAAMYRGNSGLTGAYAEEIALPLSLEWKHTTTYFGYNPTSPIVAGDTVFFSSGNRLFAVSTETGSLKWRYPQDLPLTTTFASTPAFHAGTIFAGAAEGKLYAINAETGKLAWQFDTRSTIETSPTVVDGIVYVGSGNGRVWAIDGRNGREVSTWRGGFQASDEISGAPAVANGFVYVLSMDQVLHAIGAATGKERWFYRLPGSVLRMSPVAYQEYVVVANGPNLTSFLGRNGLVRWTRVLNEDIVASPAVSDDGIFVVTADNRVMAFETRTGRPKWKSSPQLEFDVLAAPTLAGKALLVGTAQGGIYGLDTESGATKWTYVVLPSTVRPDSIVPYTNLASPLVVANKTLYALSDDGTVSAFRADAVDNSGPVITEREPEMGVVINGTPPLRFEATVLDEGSGVKPDSVRLLIDRNGVARKPTTSRVANDAPGFSYDVLTGTLEYTTSEATAAGRVDQLADGRHTVTVTASDWRGNTASRSWSFTVDNSLAKVARRRPATTPGGRPGRSGGAGGGKLGDGG